MVAILCRLSAEFGASVLVQEQLPSLVVVVVVEFEGPVSLGCGEWGLGHIEESCLCNIVVEMAVVRGLSLPLNYCQ